MNKTVLLVFVSFLSMQLINAQKTPESFVIDFFETFEKEGSSKALDNLYATNEWMTRATDAITNLKSQLEGLNIDYVGKYYGYELIVKKELTDSYVLLSYLVRYDRQPIRFTFQFYKPNKEWLIYSFQYDGNIDEEIEEAAKLYYLDLNIY